MKQTPKGWRPSRKLVLRLAVTVVLALLVLPPLLSLAMRTRPVHQLLLSRIAASFGRPVEVSHFSVSVLGGLRIEANFVTVAEDPRFGHEFFLRAERITASLRWSSLLRGRLEFGNLALLRPSLNLVRDGHRNWNLLAWLPSSATAENPPARPGAAPRLYRITVDTGRINLKLGDDKHPFALVEVNGSFASTGSGDWQMDFRAQAFRAGAMAQEPGELRVRGALGGPRSRILPADLILTWDAASVADVLRLVRGNDSGLRGTLGTVLRLQAGAPDPAQPITWRGQGSARIEGLHGWQLPPRASDPALNLQLAATWLPAAARVEIREALLESAHSSVSASGEISWAAHAPLTAPAALRLRSAGIQLGDVLAFYRAFHDEVSSAARLEGSAALDAELAGWPLRLQALRLRAPEAWLRLPGLDPGFLFQPVVAQYDPRRRELQMLPLTITLPANVPEQTRRLVFTPAEFRFSGTLRPLENWAGDWQLSGQAREASTVATVGVALGLYWLRAWQSGGWELNGPLGVQLQWQTHVFPFRARPSGTLESRRAVLRTPLLRDPVKIGVLRIEAGSAWRVALSDAEGLGARWSGWLAAVAPREWNLDLRAPRLNVAGFDRALYSGDQTAPHGLAAALAAPSAEISASRLSGRVTLSSGLAVPFLRPPRPADLALEVSLFSGPRGTFRVHGTLALPSVERSGLTASLPH